jgi:Fe-S cluster assembly protein SufD
MGDDDLIHYSELIDKLPGQLLKEDFDTYQNIVSAEHVGSEKGVVFDQSEVPLGLKTVVAGVTLRPIRDARETVLKNFKINFNNPMLQQFCWNRVFSLVIKQSIDEPIELDLTDIPANLAFTLLIHIEKNVKATIVERFKNSNDQLVLYNHQIYADEGSSVRIVNLQNMTSGSQFLEFRNAKAESKANIDFMDFQLGGKSVYGRFFNKSLNPHASINADLLCRTRESQKYHFDIKNIHTAKHGKGRILTKGTAQDSSSIRINGGINITREASETDATLKQEALLLSKNARVKSAPELNIGTGNAKAEHMASVTNLNDESLFYLTSRGIPEVKARKMMTEAFLKEQLDKISDLPELKKEIQSLI